MARSKELEGYFEVEDNMKGSDSRGIDDLYPNMESKEPSVNKVGGWEFAS